MKHNFGDYPKFGKYPKRLFERDWHNDPFIMDDLVIDSALEKEMGALRSRFEICMNTFGQNVASQSVQNMFPDQVKLLEDIFKSEKPVSAASRAGAIIDGQPAIILTYSFDGNVLNHKGVTDPILLHAQTRMMAEQLNEALLKHGVNICATFNSDFKSEDDVADGIHAIIPADRDQSMRASFEKEFDAVLSRLALSKNFEWVKSQYDVLTDELAGNTNKDWRPNLALKEGCQFADVVIEAFGFLGQHLGFRQAAFDKAKSSSNKKVHIEPWNTLSHLTKESDFRQNPGLLEKCLHNGALRAEYKGHEYVSLYTKSPLDSLYSPKQDCFQITKNELRSVLNDMGYARDFSIPSFMLSYSYETASEIKSIYEDRKKKPLDQLLNQADEKRSASEPKEAQKEIDVQNERGL